MSETTKKSIPLRIAEIIGATFIVVIGLGFALQACSGDDSPPAAAPSSVTKAADEPPAVLCELSNYVVNTDGGGISIDVVTGDYHHGEHFTVVTTTTDGRTITRHIAQPDDVDNQGQATITLPDVSPDQVRSIVMSEDGVAEKCPPTRYFDPENP